MDGGPDLFLERQGEHLALRFAYHPRWVQALKRLRLRAFDRETSTWHVPLSLVPDLVEVWEAAEAPAEWIVALRTLAREALARAAARATRERSRYEEAVPHLGDRHPGLFPHQREGVEFLLRPRDTRGAVLADEMGLGKTRQAAIAAHEAVPTGRILVVCPASVKLNWEREIRLALGPHVGSIGIAGKTLPTDTRWLIINYDLLPKWHSRLVDEEWGVLVLDEAHFIKNLGSVRSRLVLGGDRPRRRKALRDRPPGRLVGLVEAAHRVWALTGTPLTNRPLDMLALLRAIAHPLGDDLASFGVRYCAGFRNEFGWDFKGASHLEELHARLEGVFLRRRRDELLDLPPKLRTYMPVEVDLKEYRRVWTDYVAALGRQKRRSRRMLLAEIAKLRLAAAIAKIPAAIAHVRSVLENGDKVVVFTCHQVVVDTMMQVFRPCAVSVTGKDVAATRLRNVDKFQTQDDIMVMIGNLQAAGVGLTLTAASQVLFVDYSFVPAEHLQAEDRPCRIGQPRAVTVTYLSAAGTLDEEIEQLLAQKLSVVAAAVEGTLPSLSGSFVDDLVAIVARPPLAPPSA